MRFFQQLLPFHLLAAANICHLLLSSASATEQQTLQIVPTKSSSRKTYLPALKNGNLNNKLTTEQKRLLKNNIQKMILQDVYSHHDEEGRKLADGDWDFLDDFFATFTFDTAVDQTFDFGGIAFSIGTIKCDNFDISDIVTDGSGTSSQYDLSFLVEGITVQCSIDYSYKGGFFVGSGSGSLGIKLDPQTSIKTILMFTSPNFDTDPPSGASLVCNPNIEIEKVSFSNFFLDLFVAPFLPATIESQIEPFICEPLEDLEVLLADIVMMFSEVIDTILEPVPPELTDKLYPEKKFFNETFNDTSIPIYVDFLPLEPLVQVASPIIGELVTMISDTLFGMNNGTITIPIMMPLGNDTDLDLIEIRLVGLDDFTFDAVSLLGNYTLTSTYELDYIGLEIELGVQNDNGSTDVVMVTAGIDDVVFDFAFLLVLEKTILDVGTMFNFTDIVTDINGVVKDINAVGSNITDVVMDVVDILKNMTDVGTDLTSIRNDITAVGTGIIDIVMDVTDILTNFTLGSDFTSIVSDINSVGSDITDIVMDITDMLSNITIGSDFSDFNFTDVLINFTDIGTDITGIVADITDVISNFTTGSDFTDVVTDINALGTDITDIVMDIAGILNNFTITANLTDIVTDITDIGTDIIDIVTDVTNIIQGAVDMVQCLLDRVYAIEVAGLSLKSGKLDGLEISGLSQFMGPQQLFNDLSDAIYFMYDHVLINAVDSFFQTALRGSINDAIASSFVFDTCLEEFLGQTIYIPALSACWKVELFDDGAMIADYSDPGCVNDLHNHTAPAFSYFDYATTNKAYFKAGNIGWEGQIAFVEDFRVPNLAVHASVGNNTFSIDLTYPSCTQQCST